MITSKYLYLKAHFQKTVLKNIVTKGKYHLQEILHLKLPCIRRKKKALKNIDINQKLDTLALIPTQEEDYRKILWQFIVLS